MSNAFVPQTEIGNAAPETWHAKQATSSGMSRTVALMSPNPLGGHHGARARWEPSTASYIRHRNRTPSFMAFTREREFPSTSCGPDAARMIQQKKGSTPAFATVDAAKSTSPSDAAQKQRWLLTVSEPSRGPLTAAAKIASPGKYKPLFARYRRHDTTDKRCHRDKAAPAREREFIRRCRFKCSRFHRCNLEATLQNIRETRSRECFLVPTSSVETV